MKVIWIGLLLFVLLLYSSSPLQEEIITIENQPRKVENKRADFRTALSYILEHEGYYSNHPHDYGRETYCGISRVFNPDWIGWKYIDQYKLSHKIGWNDSVPNLKHWVLDHYLDIWVKEDFFSIEDQDIANYTLDLRINATIGVKVIQKTLNDMGYNIPVTNQMNSLTICTINSTEKWEFLVKLMGNRIDFYTGIVDRRQSQIVFLNHWVKRIKI